MTWTPLTPDQQKLGEQIVLWIRTARAAGYPGYGTEPWLPSGSDFTKSALFERIRSGKDPLPFPPPIAFACPWYAVVEDPGPHYVGRRDEVRFGPNEDWRLGADRVAIFQHQWRIIDRNPDCSIVIADGRGDTPYRFLLRFDPKWRHPTSTRHQDGAWFLSRAAELEDHDSRKDLPA